jgi:tetratricopeptide (TPR) repeat protein
MLRFCLHLVLLLAVLRPATVFAHGSVHERLAAVERQLAESPQDAPLLLQRARLHHEHGDHGKALEDVRAVGRIDPGCEDRWLLEADIHIAREKPELALEAVQHLLGKQPDSVAGLILRGRILETLGRIPEAIADARKVVELAPEASHHLHLIQLLERHGERADVEAAFAGARKDLGQFPVLLQRQAEWLAKTGDRPAAAKVHAELRGKVPGLAFSSYVEEARLWRGHDDARARLAIQQAEKAWSALSPAIRSRDAMQAKHRELQSLLD